MGELMQIGIIGSGTMGQGIAQVCAASGYDTILIDLQKQFLDKAVGSIGRRLQSLCDKDKISADDKRAVLGRIDLSTDYSALADCDLVIEAVSENKKIKRDVIGRLGEIVSDNCIIASNTSTISISEIGGFDKLPERVIGMHFMNPVPVLKLIEVITAEKTSPDVKSAIIDFSRKIGKTPIAVKDSPGFVLNRILIPMINEAVIILDEGIADAASIDSIMKLGAAYPLGPLALADLIGLDICLNIMEVLFADFEDKKYKPALLLQRMVSDGSLGKKSGKGFYQYDTAH